MGAEGGRQDWHEGLKGLRLWEPGFDGFRRPAEEIWRIPHGPDGGNGNRYRTPLSVAFKPRPRPSRLSKRFGHSAALEHTIARLLRAAETGTRADQTAATVQVAIVLRVNRAM